MNWFERITIELIDMDDADMWRFNIFTAVIVCIGSVCLLRRLKNENSNRNNNL